MKFLPERSKKTNMALSLRKKDTDMTTGNIIRHLAAFALPLLIGNIFQQLYNTVDSIVVGNFVSKEALAAVGCVGPIINTLIGFFIGLSTGAGVVISQHYGAHNRKGVHDAVHTTLAMTFVMCVLFTVIGVIMVPYMLRFMATPDNVFEQSRQYLRIYFFGVSGLLIYNAGAGILRAIGDSRRPLYFLIFSALTNTALDFVFVVWFRWGVAGVAVATVVSQCLSAILVLVVLTHSDGIYAITWRDIGFSREMLSKIWRIGIPSAIQQALTAFSNVFVQSYINRFGAACMAGWTSYNKIDSFAMLPMMSIALSTTTFVGQNLGAGNIKRAKKGTTYAFFMALILAAIVLIPLMIFAEPLISMFNKEPDVLEYGTLFVRIISPFFLLCSVNQVYSSSLRGAGDARAPMIIMLASFVAFRQLYLFVTYRFIGTIIPVALGYPAGWLMCSALIYIYYRWGNWEKKRVMVTEHQ